MTDVRPADQFPPVEVVAGQRVFILTGSGISAESGLRTFRDSGGLWEEYPVEQVASPEGWERDPKLVWRFYSERRAQAAKSLPNAAHLALAKLQQEIGARLTLCTQNVDGLHEAAGSRGVFHMHGELFQSRCESIPGGDGDPGATASCQVFHDEALYLEGPLPTCPSCGARIRPHICWFGEMPFQMGTIQEALVEADLFLTVGSSGAVYPAASFVALARRARSSRVRTLYIGPEPPENAFAFDECRLGKAGEVLPALFKTA